MQQDTRGSIQFWEDYKKKKKKKEKRIDTSLMNRGILIGFARFKQK